MTGRAGRHERLVFYGPPLPLERNVAGRTFPQAAHIRVGRLRRQHMLTTLELLDIQEQRQLAADERRDLEAAIRIVTQFGSPTKETP